MLRNALAEPEPKAAEPEPSIAQMFRETVAEDQPKAGLASAIGEVVTTLPAETFATLLSAAQGISGTEVSPETQDWADQLISHIESQRERRLAKYDLDREIGFGFRMRDIAQLPQNLAYSLSNLVVGGIGWGVGGLLTGGLGSWAASMGLSGAAAYRMASSQIMRSYLEEMQDRKGQPLTAEEEAKLKADFGDRAFKYGLWEAVPEAVGTGSMIGVMGNIMKKMIGQELSKAVLVRAFGKFAGLQAGEMAQEVVTEIGQSQTLAGTPVGEAGNPLSFTEPSDYWTALKRIAPQTFLITSIMGGASASYIHTYNKMLADPKNIDTILDVYEEGQFRSDAETPLSDQNFVSIGQLTEMMAKKYPDNPELIEARNAFREELNKRAREIISKTDLTPENVAALKENPVITAANINIADIEQDVDKAAVRSMDPGTDQIKTPTPAYTTPTAAEELSEEEIETIQTRVIQALAKHKELDPKKVDEYLKAFPGKRPHAVYAREYMRQIFKDKTYGVAEESRAEVDEIIERLGSIEAVEKTYTPKAGVISLYARDKAREIGLPETAEEAGTVVPKAEEGYIPRVDEELITQTQSLIDEMDKRIEEGKEAHGEHAHKPGGPLYLNNLYNTVSRLEGNLVRIRKQQEDLEKGVKRGDTYLPEKLEASIRALRKKVEAIDLSDPDYQPITEIPEGEDLILQEAGKQPGTGELAEFEIDVKERKLTNVHEVGGYKVGLQSTERGAPSYWLAMDSEERRVTAVGSTPQLAVDKLKREIARQDLQARKEAEFRYSQEDLNQLLKTRQGKAIRRIAAARNIEGHERARFRTLIDRILEQQEKAAAAEEVTEEMEATFPADITVYRSGAGRVDDMAGYRRSGVPVGINLRTSTAEAIDEAIEYANEEDGKVFIDTGAYQVRGDEEINWKDVFKKYRDIIDRTKEKARKNLTIVAPDVVGNQEKTLALLDEHKDEIKDLRQQVKQIVVPLPIGDLQPSEMYSKVLDIFGRGFDFVAGLPSSQEAHNIGKAYTPYHVKELQNFVEGTLRAKLTEGETPQDIIKVHFLGISPASSRWAKLHEAVHPDWQVSTDAARIPAKAGQDRPLTEAFRRIFERYAEDYDDTEAWGDILDTSGVLTDEQISRLSAWTDVPLDELIEAHAEGRLRDVFDEEDIVEGYLGDEIAMIIRELAEEYGREVAREEGGRADAVAETAIDKHDVGTVITCCVKKKGPEAAKAKDLYTSKLWKGYRAFAEKMGQHWKILSGEHGLVDPEDKLDPYEKDLTKAPAAERKAWAEKVAPQIIKAVKTKRITFLGGVKYREYLIPLLEEAGFDVVVPMEKMDLFKQHKYLSKAAQGIIENPGVWTRGQRPAAPEELADDELMAIMEEYDLEDIDDARTVQKSIPLLNQWVRIHPDRVAKVTEVGHLGVKVRPHKRTPLPGGSPFGWFSPSWVDEVYGKKPPLTEISKYADKKEPKAEVPVSHQPAQAEKKRYSALYEKAFGKFAGDLKEVYRTHPWLERSRAAVQAMYWTDEAALAAANIDDFVNARLKDASNKEQREALEEFRKFAKDLFVVSEPKEEGVAEDPFVYQDRVPEKIVHRNWDLANSFRFVLEGAGDILRSYASTADRGYIEEKLKRVDKFLTDYEKGKLHRDDSREMALEHEPKNLEDLIEAYENQPTVTRAQEAARQLVLALAKGDFGRARRIHFLISENQFEAFQPVRWGAMEGEAHRIEGDLIDSLIALNKGKPTTELETEQIIELIPEVEPQTKVVFDKTIYKKWRPEIEKAIHWTLSAVKDAGMLIPEQITVRAELLPEGQGGTLSTDREGNKGMIILNSRKKIFGMKRTNYVDAVVHETVHISQELLRDRDQFPVTPEEIRADAQLLKDEREWREAISTEGSRVLVKDEEQMDYPEIVQGVYGTVVTPAKSFATGEKVLVEHELEGKTVGRWYSIHKVTPAKPTEVIPEMPKEKEPVTAEAFVEGAPTKRGPHMFGETAEDLAPGTRTRKKLLEDPLASLESRIETAEKKLREEERVLAKTRKNAYKKRPKIQARINEWKKEVHKLKQERKPLADQNYRTMLEDALEDPRDRAQYLAVQNQLMEMDNTATDATRKKYREELTKIAAEEAKRQEVFKEDLKTVVDTYVNNLMTHPLVDTHELEGGIEIEKKRAERNRWLPAAIEMIDGLELDSWTKKQLNDKLRQTSIWDPQDADAIVAEAREEEKRQRERSIQKDIEEYSDHLLQVKENAERYEPWTEETAKPKKPTKAALGMGVSSDEADRWFHAFLNRVKVWTTGRILDKTMPHYPDFLELTDPQRMEMDPIDATDLYNKAKKKAKNDLPDPIAVEAKTSEYRHGLVYFDVTETEPEGKDLLAINKVYYDYFRHKYPGATFKYSNVQEPIVVYHEGKDVGLVMPLRAGKDLGDILAYLYERNELLKRDPYADIELPEHIDKGRLAILDRMIRSAQAVLKTQQEREDTDPAWKDKVAYAVEQLNGLRQIREYYWEGRKIPDKMLSDFNAGFMTPPAYMKRPRGGLLHPKGVLEKVEKFFDVRHRAVNEIAMEGASLLSHPLDPEIDPDEYDRWLEVVRLHLGDKNAERVDAKARELYQKFTERTDKPWHMLNAVRYFFQKGLGHLGWYERSREAIEKKYGEDADIFMQIIAITSANRSVEVNHQLAEKAYKQWKEGKYKFVDFPHAMRINLQAMARGEPWYDQVRDPANRKTRLFYKALKGDPNAIAVDLWIRRAFGYSVNKDITANDYDYIEAAIRQFARETGQTPRDIQESIWMGIKLTEPTGRYRDIKDFSDFIQFLKRYRTGEERTPRQRLDMESFRAQYPEADIKTDEQGRLNLTFEHPEGPRTLLIEWVDEIEPDDYGLHFGYGEKKLNKDEVLAGSYHRGHMRLVINEANEVDLSHESYHAFEDLFYGRREIKVMSAAAKKAIQQGKLEASREGFEGNVEDRANLFAQIWHEPDPTTFAGRLVAKARDFIHMIANATGIIRTARGMVLMAKRGEYPIGPPGEALEAPAFLKERKPYQGIRLDPLRRFMRHAFRSAESMRFVDLIEGRIDQFGDPEGNYASALEAWDSGVPFYEPWVEKAVGLGLTKQEAHNSYVEAYGMPELIGKFQLGDEFAQKATPLSIARTPRTPEEGPITPSELPKLFRKRKKDIAAEEREEAAKVLREVLPEEVAEEFERARGLGQFQQTGWEKIKQATKDFAISFIPQREYPYLPAKFFAKAINVLRAYKETPGYGKKRARDLLLEILNPRDLSPAQYNLFRTYIILSDLVHDMEDIKGRPLREWPRILQEKGRITFGFTSKEQVDEAHAKVTELVAKDKKVQRALKRREKRRQWLVKQAVERGLLPEAAIDDPRYYHHQVLKHHQLKFGVSTFTKGMRPEVPKRGYQIHQIETIEAFNTEYYEAEFEWMAHSISQIEGKDNLDSMGETYDHFKEFAGKAKNINLNNFYKIVMDPETAERDDEGSMIDPLQPFRKTIAKAITTLGKLAAEEKLYSPAEFEQVIIDLKETYQMREADMEDYPDEPELWTQVSAEKTPFYQFLSYLVKHGHPGSKAASKILKAIRARNALIEQTIKERGQEKGFEFETPYTRMVKEEPWEGSQGWIIWKPKPNSVWYRMLSIEEKLLDRFLEGSLGRQLNKETDFREVYRRGHDLEWIVPVEVARAMDEVFGMSPTEDAISRFLEGGLNWWKRWILFNPMRIIKYNVNNMSGDLDIALAADPGILKHAWQAAWDLRDWHMRHRPPGGRLDKALRRKYVEDPLYLELDRLERGGTIGSGMTMHDIPDIGKGTELEKLQQAISGEKPSIIMRWWKTGLSFSIWRENVLRLAAYRRAMELLEKGENPYWASDVNKVDATESWHERASLIARELIGDYGAISPGGMWLRRKLIPFYSWMEINAPRYVRLMRNLPHEGQKKGQRVAMMSGVGLKKAAMLGVKINILFMMVNLWNRTIFPDEERELGEQGRRQLHLILGRRDDGSILTLRFQGALSDALAWFGAEDFPQDVRDMAERRKTMWQWFAEAPVEAANKVFQGIRPEVKALIEFPTGRSTWPDFTRGRPIRDPIEHVSRTFSADWIYRALRGMPRRGDTFMGKLVEDLMSTALYTSDPGEASYYAIRSWANEYAEKHHAGKPAVEPTTRGNALYYYKQALKYGDVKAAYRYLDKYQELGGTPRGIKISIKLAHPLGGLQIRFRKPFMRSLTPDQKETYNMAVKWYRETYLRKKRVRRR